MEEDQLNYTDAQPPLLTEIPGENTPGSVTYYNNCTNQPLTFIAQGKTEEVTIYIARIKIDNNSLLVAVKKITIPQNTLVILSIDSEMKSKRYKNPFPSSTPGWPTPWKRRAFSYCPMGQR